MHAAWVIVDNLRWWGHSNLPMDNNFLEFCHIRKVWGAQPPPPPQVLSCPGDIGVVGEFGAQGLWWWGPKFKNRHGMEPRGGGWLGKRNGWTHLKVFTDFMRSILTTHVKVIQTTRKHILWIFWSVLTIIKCDLKIDLIMSWASLCRVLTNHLL